MAVMTPTDVTFFATPADLRKWFATHHAQRAELWLGYYKRDSGKPSVTWPESVDEALCVGWIDGIRKSLGDESYVIRFTPRKPGSVWSKVNVGRVDVLTAEGRMRPAGVAAFAARSEAKSGIYAFEQTHTDLGAAELRVFKRDKLAWAFYRVQPPSYRKRMSWWVMSAKRVETQASRLRQLIAASAEERRL